MHEPLWLDTEDSVFDLHEPLWLHTKDSVFYLHEPLSLHTKDSVVDFCNDAHIWSYLYVYLCCICMQ